MRLTKDIESKFKIDFEKDLEVITETLNIQSNLKLLQFKE
jgi:hypothetical protein